VGAIFGWGTILEFGGGQYQYVGDILVGPPGGHFFVPNCPPEDRLVIPNGPPGDSLGHQSVPRGTLPVGGQNGVLHRQQKHM
jgi:hypothetical protein